MSEKQMSTQGVDEKTRVSVEKLFSCIKSYAEFITAALVVMSFPAVVFDKILMPLFEMVFSKDLSYFHSELMLIVNWFVFSVLVVCFSLLLIKRMGRRYLKILVLVFLAGPLLGVSAYKTFSFLEKIKQLQAWNLPVDLFGYCPSELHLKGEIEPRLDSKTLDSPRGLDWVNEGVTFIKLEQFSFEGNEDPIQLPETLETLVLAEVTGLNNLRVFDWRNVKLKNLVIQNCLDLRNLEGLANIPESNRHFLKVVKLIGNAELIDLGAIGSFEQISRLEISESEKFSDLAFISALGRLNYLHLGHLNKGVDIDVFKGLSSLKDLYLSNSNVNELSAFADSRFSLNRIELVNNPIKDLDKLTPDSEGKVFFPNVSALRISARSYSEQGREESSFSQLDLLGRCGNITELRLHGFQEIDLASIDLYLGKCHILELANVRKLRSQEFLRGLPLSELILESVTLLNTFDSDSPHFGSEKNGKYFSSLSCLVLKNISLQKGGLLKLGKLGELKSISLIDLELDSDWSFLNIDYLPKLDKFLLHNVTRFTDLGVLKTFELSELDVSVQSVSLYGLWSVRMGKISRLALRGRIITKNFIWLSECEKLQVLTLESMGDLRNLSLPFLDSLEELRITNCTQLQSLDVGRNFHIQRIHLIDVKSEVLTLKGLRSLSNVNELALPRVLLFKDLDHYLSPRKAEFLKTLALGFKC